MNLEELKTLEAKLAVTPVEIIDIFFSHSLITIYPAHSPEDFVSSVNLKDMRFSAKIINVIEKDKLVYLSVGISNSLEEQKHKGIEFNIVCIGGYAWRGDVFDEDAVKKIFNWGVSIQVSSIRQHIAQETARSPYRTPWYFPIALVQIDNTSKDTPLS